MKPSVQGPISKNARPLQKNSRSTSALRIFLTATRTNEFLARLRSAFNSISDLPIPTITALSSVALGGGLELALTTHLRVFGSTATVGLPETRLAIIPGAGGTYRLPALIGQSNALDLMLTGRRVSGKEAYSLGLCNRLVNISEEEAKIPGRSNSLVLAAAIDLANKICEGGPGAIKAVLRAAGKGETAENKAYETVVGMEDRNEALAAFQEKRKPVYRGM
jgi:methylglutaconyl-CoA hydratase